MKVKILEIRDKGTFIPVLCVDMNPAGDAPITEEAYMGRLYLMRRVGYPCDGRPNIAMTRLDAGGGRCWNDPYGWTDGTRTFPVAHNWIIENWDKLKDGDVVCVEHILGERDSPKVSERVSVPV